MHREINGFGTIAPEILSEICEDPTYARFRVVLKPVDLIIFTGVVGCHRTDNVRLASN